MIFRSYDPQGAYEPEPGWVRPVPGREQFLVKRTWFVMPILPSGNLLTRRCRWTARGSGVHGELTYRFGQFGLSKPGRQVERLRCGAGGIRSRLSTRRTVDAPTRYQGRAAHPACQPSGHHGRNTRRSASYAPFWNPTGALCGDLLSGVA